MYVAVGEEQGIPRGELRGTVQNDIIKEYLARKTYIFPPEPSLRLATDIIEFCANEMPYFNPISVTGYHVRESGASAVQEIAYTLAAAITYVERVLARGIDIDDFAPQVSFHFSMGREFFEEVAKIRACRRLWAGIVRERFGARNARSMRMRFFNGGSGASLAANEPLNNVIRGTIQCLAGVCAGAQACHVPAFDEAYSIPSEQSASLALRTQQIIAFESGVAKTVDPLAGSYYVESLTNRLEEEVRTVIGQIEAGGGLVAAIEHGDLQRAILDHAYKIERDKNAGERLVVGVNAFRTEEEAADIVLQDRDSSVLERQVARLERARAQRDTEAVARALEELHAAAEGEENLMPYVLAAVKAYATVGEVVGVLKEVFGEYRESVSI
jgi:methylmalonyl-CoA mutase N-terminal domain/subunit